MPWGTYSPPQTGLEAGDDVGASATMRGNTGTFVNETTELFTKLQPIEKEGQAMGTLEIFLQCIPLYLDT